MIFTSVNNGDTLNFKSKKEVKFNGLEQPLIYFASKATDFV